MGFLFCANEKISSFFEEMLYYKATNLLIVHGKKNICFSKANKSF